MTRWSVEDESVSPESEGIAHSRVVLDSFNRPTRGRSIGSELYRRVGGASPARGEKGRPVVGGDIFGTCGGFDISGGERRQESVGDALGFGGVRQRLSAVIEEEADEGGEGMEIGDGNGGAIAHVELDHGGMNFRRGPECLRRQFADAPTFSEEAGQYGDGTVVVGRWRGEESVGDFGLNGETHARDAEVREEEIDDERRGDVVGKIGDKFERAAEFCAGLFHGIDERRCEGGLAGERVGMDEADVLEGGEVFRGDGEDVGVNLDRNDAARTLGEETGEAAGADADFEDAVGGIDGGGIEQSIHQVSVDEKALAEPFFGRCADGVKPFTDDGLGLEG